MKQKPPSKEEAVKLVLKDANLLKTAGDHQRKKEAPRFQ
jgi:hypothetical protein